MFSVQELFKGGHITDTALLAISCDLLELEEKQLLLSHIGSCEECRAAFILDMETDLMEDELVPQLEQSMLFLMEEEKKLQEEKKNRFRFVQITKLAIAVCLTLVMFTGLALVSYGGDGQLQYAGQRQMSTDVRKDIKTLEKEKKIGPGEQLLNFTQGLYNSFYNFSKGIGTNNTKH